jgi:hypothetical protein
MSSPARARTAHAPRPRPAARPRVATAEPKPAPSVNGAKRRYVRFPAEGNTSACIDLSAGPKPFTPRLQALVYEESYGGCGLIVLKGVVFEPGDVIRIQVGRLAPMRAEVRWCMNVDQHVQRLGVMYLD